MNRIVYAPRPVLDNSFNFRAVKNTVEMPEALKSFFVQCGVGTDAFGAYSLLKGAPSAFAGLGVKDKHLMNAVKEAMAVCVAVLPKDLTQMRVRGATQLGMGAAPPPGTGRGLGSKKK